MRIRRVLFLISLVASTSVLIETEPQPAVATPPSYESVVLNDNPDSYYRLGESSGTLAADDSGNGHDASYVGSPTLDEAGALDGDSDTSSHLNGNGDYLDTGRSANLTSAFSLEAWINPDSTSTVNESIVSKRSYYAESWSDWPVALDYLGGTLGAVLTLSKGDDYSIDASLNTGALSAGWHHVVATYKGGDFARLYVDGSLASSTSIDFSVSSNSRDWTIGRQAYRSSTSVPDQSFVGYVDEVAIYGHALSAGRVLTHYEAAQGDDPSSRDVFLRWDLAADNTSTDTTTMAIWLDGEYLGTASAGAPFGWRPQSFDVSGLVDPDDFGSHVVTWQYTDGYDTSHVRRMRIVDESGLEVWYDQYHLDFYDSQPNSVLGTAYDGSSSSVQLDPDDGSYVGSGTMVEHYFPGDHSLHMSDEELSAEFADAAEAQCNLPLFSAMYMCTYELMVTYEIEGVVTVQHCDIVDEAQACSQVSVTAAVAPEDQPVIPDESPYQPEGEGWEWASRSEAPEGTPRRGVWRRLCEGTLDVFERVFIDFHDPEDPNHPNHFDWHPCGQDDVKYRIPYPQDLDIAPYLYPTKWW